MSSFRVSAAAKLGALAVVVGAGATGCGFGPGNAGFFEVPGSPYYGVAVLKGGTDATILLCRPVVTTVPRPDLQAGATPDGYEDPDQVPPYLLKNITDNVDTEPGDVTRTVGVDGLPDQACGVYDVSSNGWGPSDEIEGVTISNGAVGAVVLLPGTSAADHRLASSQFDGATLATDGTDAACAQLADAVRTRSGNVRPSLPGPCHTAVPSGTPTRTAPAR